MSNRSMAHATEHEIDRRTDDEFWRATGVPRGHRLNRYIAADHALINTWLSIRYRVAQEVARERGL